MLEVGAGGFGIFVEGWDGHQAADFKVVQGLDGDEKGGQVLGRESVLRFFRREFDLNQDPQRFAESLGGGVESLSRFGGIEGVDGVKDLRCLGGLVVLQWPNEVGLRDR